jgi:hypothetical protein
MFQTQYIFDQQACTEHWDLPNTEIFKSKDVASGLGMSTFRFFVIENNSFFAFVHEKKNVSLFFLHIVEDNFERFCFVFLMLTAKLE